MNINNNWVYTVHSILNRKNPIKTANGKLKYKPIFAFFLIFSSIVFIIYKYDDLKPIIYFSEKEIFCSKHNTRIDLNPLYKTTTTR